MKRYAESPEFEAKNQYWLEQKHISQHKLPKDNEQETGLAEDRETIIVQWTEEETERLLKKSNRAYTTDINDLLLTGLGMAVHRWTGHEEIRVHLEGHGRESVFKTLIFHVRWAGSQPNTRFLFKSRRTGTSPSGLGR